MLSNYMRKSINYIIKNFSFLIHILQFLIFFSKLFILFKNFQGTPCINWGKTISQVEWSSYNSHASYIFATISVWFDSDNNGSLNAICICFFSFRYINFQIAISIFTFQTVVYIINKIFNAHYTKNLFGKTLK